MQQVYNLYYSQMVNKLHINKEMPLLHNCYHHFVHPLYQYKYIGCYATGNGEW